MIDGQKVTLDQAISQGCGDLEERQEASTVRLVQLLLWRRRRRA